MKRFYFVVLLLTTLLLQGFVNAQTIEQTTLQKVREMLLQAIPDSAGLANANQRVDTLTLKVDSLKSAVNNVIPGQVSGNPDSLNDLPASAYMLKNDSTIFASRYYTDSQLLTKANSNHNHNGVYEPVISKFAGYLRWNGSNWSFLNETYIKTSDTTLQRTYSDIKYADNITTQTALNSKQATLVSSINIKTVNGSPILGSGNITVAGTDSDAVKDLALAEMTTKLDTMKTETSTYTMNEVDSILTLAQTLINALRGGTTGQALVKVSNTDFDFEWAAIGTIDLSDNTPPDPPTLFEAFGGTATDQFISTWSEGGMLATDVDSIRFYAGTTNDSTALVWIESIPAGIETYTYRSLDANTTYWSAVKAVDDSGNVSYFSNIDSATTLSGGAASYTEGYAYVWNHLTEANNTLLDSWEDSTTNLAIYTSVDFAPTNVDSGVVWTADDRYLRQVASFPAGLFDSAFTIEMVVKVVRTDSTQAFFWARNASNVAMGIGIGSTGIFVGNIYDLTDGVDYTHNSTATTGWHVLHFTWDGTANSGDYYVDGTLVSDTGDFNQYEVFSGDNRLGMGATGGLLPLASGTLTPYIAVYKHKLNSTEVLNNYNSDVIQLQIPAWAR